MGQAAKKLFIWSGGNNFKLNSDGTPNQPANAMTEAAMQRDQIRREQLEWEANRANGHKVPELIAQLLKTLSK